MLAGSLSVAAKRNRDRRLLCHYDEKEEDFCHYDLSIPAPKHKTETAFCKSEIALLPGPRQDNTF